MVYPGSAVSWNRQDCNRQSMQRVQNTWSTGSGLCLNARTQMWFSKEPFFILVVRNNKRSSGIGGKTSECPSRNCLYYRYLEIRFYGAPSVKILWQIWHKNCYLRKFIAACIQLSLRAELLLVTVLLIVLTWLLFFRWFPRVTSAACKKLPA